MNDRRNATSSWSGYLHQGKVGILLALKELYKCILASEDISLYKLEYESAEDIDIKKQDIILSRHQVKAYKNAQYPNDYIDVLNEQIYQYIDDKLALVQKGFQIHKYNQDGNILFEEVGENSRYLHTISKVRGFNFSKEDFERDYPRAKYIPNPNNIKLYCYPDGNDYCDLSEGEEDKLQKFCVEEIENLLSHAQHEYKDDKSYHIILLNDLLGLLDRRIRTSHSDGGHPVITLQEIYNTIMSTEKISEQIIGTMRRIFADAWYGFIVEIEEDKITDWQKGNVESIVSQISQKNDDDFSLFIRNINPHIPCDSENISLQDAFNMISEGAVIDYFYELLINVERYDFDLDFIGYKADGGYLFTLIDRKQSHVNKVVKDIMNNSKLTRGLFDRKYLINGKIDKVKIGETFLKSSSALDMNWKRRLEEKDKFYNPDMSLVTVESAIEKLNSKDVE